MIGVGSQMKEACLVVATRRQRAVVSSRQGRIDNAVEAEKLLEGPLGL